MVLGLDESSLRYVVDPTYRSGTVLRVEPPRSIYAGGVLLSRSEEPLAYRLGAWQRPDGATGEFFTDHEGYFEIYGLEPGTYTLSLPNEAALRFTFTIADDAAEYVDLGSLATEEVR
jgi:outer membrane usher protein